jgi:hypothetical protein
MRISSRQYKLVLLPCTVCRGRGKTKIRKTAAYSLSYFTLWWMRVEVEGRKDAKRLERMVEDETCQKRKRKLMNIPESEKSEPNELVSGTDDYHELRKCT